MMKSSMLKSIGEDSQCLLFVRVDEDELNPLEPMKTGVMKGVLISKDRGLH